MKFQNTPEKQNQAQRSHQTLFSNLQDNLVTVQAKSEGWVSRARK